MRAASAQLQSAPRSLHPVPRSTFVPRFTFEAHPEQVNLRTLALSLAIHSMLMTFGWPGVHQRVHLAPVLASPLRTPLTIIYSPSLPNVESGSSPAARSFQTARGVRQRSPREFIQVIAVKAEPALVLAATKISASADPNNLASVIQLSSANRVGLAVQPTTIKSDRPSRVDPPPPSLALNVAAAPAPKLVVARSEIAVRLAPQGRSVVSGSGRGLIRPASEPPPDVTSNQQIGTEAFPSGVLNGAVSTVVNPAKGSWVESSADETGRIAAAPNGLPAGQGLGQFHGGRSDAGDRGNDPGLHGSPANGSGLGVTGSGGAGTAPAGPNTAISVKNGVVELGSFAPNTPPSDRGAPRGRRPDIVIVSSSNAGGALQKYVSQLRGQVYTVFLNASGATAVMQYSERKSAALGEAFSADITPPESISTELPKELRDSPQVISCVLSPDGVLKDLRVLGKVGPEVLPAWIAALTHWRFRPAYRGDAPVPVNVVIGFKVDTN